MWICMQAAMQTAVVGFKEKMKILNKKKLNK